MTVQSDVAFTFQICKPDLATTTYDVCLVDTWSGKESISN